VIRGLLSKLLSPYCRRVIQASVEGENFDSEVILNSIADDAILKYLSSKISSDNELYDVERSYHFMRYFLPKYSDVFASQEGEDILIKRLLKDYYYRKGFYIDIGAHDPIKFSNSFHYYLRGWNGINIDPVPGMKEKFDAIRPKDRNIETGIGLDCDEMEYYVFSEPAFNTCFKEQADYAKSRTDLVEVRMVKVQRLGDVLNREMPLGQEVDFMSVDVEGAEYDVLSSADWERVRPRIICCESLSTSAENKITNLLEDNGYLKIASTKNSIMYCEKEFWAEVK